MWICFLYAKTVIWTISTKMVLHQLQLGICIPSSYISFVINEVSIATQCLNQPVPDSTRSLTCVTYFDVTLNEVQNDLNTISTIPWRKRQSGSYFGMSVMIYSISLCFPFTGRCSHAELYLLVLSSQRGRSHRGYHVRYWHPYQLQVWIRHKKAK